MEISNLKSELKVQIDSNKLVMDDIQNRANSYFESVSKFKKNDNVYFKKSKLMKVIGFFYDLSLEYGYCLCLEIVARQIEHNPVPYYVLESKLNKYE